MWPSCLERICVRVGLGLSSGLLELVLDDAAWGVNTQADNVLLKHAGSSHAGPWKAFEKQEGS